MADMEPKKGCTSGGLLVSHGFFFGLLISSWNASPRRTDDSGQIFGKPSKDPSQNSRAPYQPFAFRRKNSILAKSDRFRRKKAFQEFAKSLRKFTLPVPQKERLFRVMTTKNALFPSKKFSAFFQNLDKKPQVNHMAKSRKPWKKLAKNDPNLALPHPHDLSIYHFWGFLRFLFFWGFVCFAPLQFAPFNFFLFVCFVVFDVVFFIHCCFSSFCCFEVRKKRRKITKKQDEWKHEMRETKSRK